MEQQIQIKRTVDVRTLPGPQRHPTIFNTFASLAPGEAMLLVNDHDPKPLYYQFEREQTGKFEWQYLQKGPREWQVAILKLQPPAAPVYPEAINILAGEHKEILEHLATSRVWLPLLQSEGAGMVERLRPKMTAFLQLIEEDLNGHVANEERALYPILSRYVGSVSGPIPQMMQERQLLDTHVAGFRQGLSSGDPDLLARSAAGIVSVLTAHIQKEDNSLFPLALQSLTAENWQKVLELIKAQGK